MKMLCEEGSLWVGGSLTLLQDIISYDTLYE